MPYDARFAVHSNWKFGRPTPRDARTAFGHSLAPSPSRSSGRAAVLAIALILALAWVVTV